MPFRKTKQFNSNEKYSQFLQMLFSGEQPIYVMGWNKYVEHVSHVLGKHSRDICSFIDDLVEGEKFLGKPVISSSVLPSDCIVISYVVDDQACDRLKACSVVNVIDYNDLAALKPEEYPRPRSSENSERDIRVNCDKFEQLQDILEDNALNSIDCRVQHDLPTKQRYEFTI